VPLPIPRFSVSGVRKQRDIACSFDSFRKHALMRCAIAGDTSGQDLSTLRKVILQQSNVLKIDQIGLVDAKATYASSMHAPAAAATTAHWATILIVFIVVSTATRAFFIIG
jgi:hypothetical protein